MNGQVHPVHPKHVAVELRHVFENDGVALAHCTTSRARSRLFSSIRHTTQMPSSIIHAQPTGTSLEELSSSRPRKVRCTTGISNRSAHTRPIRYERFSSPPQ